MYFDDLTTYRIKARLKQTELASLIGMSRDTVVRIEKHKKSTHETLGKVVDALNAHHFNGIKQPLDEKSVLTNTSRFGNSETTKEVA